jgi:hypothetical protein
MSSIVPHNRWRAILGNSTTGFYIFVLMPFLVYAILSVLDKQPWEGIEIGRA